MFGILLGLASAFLQSCSYLASGRYVREQERPAYTLIPPSFLLMGLLALPLVPVCGPAQWPPASSLVLPILLCILTSCVGNAAMFFLLKYVDGSRSSPLLALKVPLMALWYLLVVGESMGPLKWFGIALVIVSAFLLGGAGRRIPLKAWGWLFVACVVYCASDLSLVWTIAVCAPYFPEGGVMGKSLFACVLIHCSLGVFGLCTLPFVRKWSARMWGRYALPYAALWFAAMLTLYVNFSISGAVLGNIVQSTRGLLSVVLGWVIARSGSSVLEEYVAPRVVVRRVFAAVFIIVAMACYSLG